MNWVMSQPITLQIEMDEDGTFIVSDSVFVQHGDGDTPKAAMSAWWESVTVLYRILLDSAHTNDANARYLDYVRQWVHHKFDEGKAVDD